MKLTDTAPQDVALPDFMREGWLEETLAELDRAKLTPEERAHWEMTIAGNMSMVAAHIEKLLRSETLSVSQIAQVQDVSEQFVLSVQEEEDNREKR